MEEHCMAWFLYINTFFVITRKVSIGPLEDMLTYRILTPYF